jgi:hypothetical protein
MREVMILRFDFGEGMLKYVSLKLNNKVIEKGGGYSFGDSDEDHVRMGRFIDNWLSGKTTPEFYLSK